MRNLRRSELVVVVGLVLVLGAALPGWAQKGDESEPPVQVTRVPVPDNGYDGSLGSMACLSSAQAAGIIQDVNVQVALTHTWVGDVVIKVVSPSNEVLTLLSRPGLVEAADDGEGCCGDSSNLAMTSPILFDDSATISAENMGSTLDSSGVICQDDGECTFIPAPGAGPGTSLAQFIGQDAAGTWQVCVGDSAGGDTGDFDSFQLQITAQPVIQYTGIPTLSSVGIVALVGLLLTAGFFVIRRFS